jgi:hypothetical protein
MWDDNCKNKINECIDHVAQYAEARQFEKSAAKRAEEEAAAAKREVEEVLEEVLEAAVREVERRAAAEAGKQATEEEKAAQELKHLKETLDKYDKSTKKKSIRMPGKRGSRRIPGA